MYSLNFLRYQYRRIVLVCDLMTQSFGTLLCIDAGTASWYLHNKKHRKGLVSLEIFCLNKSDDSLLLADARMVVAKLVGAELSLGFMQGLVQRLLNLANRLFSKVEFRH